MAARGIAFVIVVFGMIVSKTNSNRLSFLVFILTIISIFCLFAYEGNKGFSLADEGYLWYGVQRVMLGEVPIRDFMAYDPGRYYWSAIFMQIFNDNGIMALRVTISIIQGIGLYIALILIIRSEKQLGLLYAIMLAGILLVWMIPRHKLFDITMSISLVGIFTYLIQRPTRQRFFFSGILIGIVTLFGRNHGLYGFLACSITIFYLHYYKLLAYSSLSSAVIFLGVGLIFGYSPLFFLMVKYPGFSRALIDSVNLLLENKSTNLTLPIPWPWRVDFSVSTFGQSTRNALIGVFFVLMPIFSLVSIIWLFRQKDQARNIQPEFVAASFVSLPYLHVAYSRADVNHLAQGIFPLLIGSLISFSKKSLYVRWLLTSTIFGISFWIIYVFHPGVQCQNEQCVNIVISESNLLINPAVAREVEMFRGLAEQYAPNGEDFIAAPFWPGAYSLLGVKSPVWTLYHPLAPLSAEFQLSEIKRIKENRPRFVVISNSPLDGNEATKFNSRQPVVYSYIKDNFKKTSNYLNSPYEIYIAK